MTSNTAPQATFKQSGQVEAIPVYNVDQNGVHNNLSTQSGQPMTLADGAAVTFGAKTDAAVTGDTAGTFSAKLRGLVKILTDIWDSVNHRLNIGPLPAINSTAIAAGTTANTVVKTSAGTFYGILITTVGAGSPSVYDNATTNSGKVVGQVGASASLGLASSTLQGVSCANGITVAGGATNPAMTILWL